MTQHIPKTAFYFIRHGQTDWNKYKNTLCHQDDIPLNETGIEQVTNLRNLVEALPIRRLFSSPLARAKETAEIIVKNHSTLKIQLHDGLGKIDPQILVYTFTEILNDGELPLIVSHGEVYRVLLNLLNIETDLVDPKNGGLYVFAWSTIKNKWCVVDGTPEK